MTVEIRRAERTDLPSIAEIYRESFPEMIKPRLGRRVCVRFFDEYLKHDAYRLITARLDGEVLGFSLIHTDLTRSVDSRRWIRRSWFDLILFLLKNPLFTGTRIARLPGTLLERRKRSARRPADRDRTTPKEGGSKPTAGYIAPIAVAGAARGHGVGRKLIGASIDVARENDLDLLKLNVDRQNFGAIRLYEKMGFRKTGILEERNEYSYTFDCREHDVDCREHDASSPASSRRSTT